MCDLLKQEFNHSHFKQGTKEYWYFAATVQVQTLYFWKIKLWYYLYFLLIWLVSRSTMKWYPVPPIVTSSLWNFSKISQKVTTNRYLKNSKQKLNTKYFKRSSDLKKFFALLIKAVFTVDTSPFFFLFYPLISSVDTRDRFKDKFSAHTRMFVSTRKL